MNHTPAPWAWQRFGDTYSLTAQHGMREIIIGAIKHGQMNYPVVGMNNEGRLTDVDPSFPNARLIAAAPELLDALEKLLPKLSQLQDESAFTWPEKIEALIAKAKGS